MIEILVGHLLGGAVLGLVTTRLLIPLVRVAGWLDYPDCQRKLQREAVPIGGGVAVFVATLAVLGAGSWWWAEAAALWEPVPSSMAGLLAAAVAVLLLGVIDDRYHLRARYKLLGQVAAAVILMIWGECLIMRVGLFGWVVELGLLALPVTLLWLLACINALNLIDGMDGLLGTLGGIALASFGVLALLAGQLLAALIAFSLLGAVLGFLWWNLPPARIYMGDAGSMLIGLVVGALAMQTSLKGSATLALGAPLAILALPLLDTVAAVVRRKLTGRGLAVADRGHLHHVLLRQGLTVWRVLALAALLGTLGAGGALASIILQNDLYAVVSTAAVVVALVAGKLFGYAEWKLLQKRLATAAYALLPRDCGSHGRELAIHLQGAAPWNLLWQELVAAAQRLQLESICLDVNAPAWHENFHARWEGISSPEATFLWRLEVPLLLDRRPLGRLIVTVPRSQQSLAETMQALLQIIEAAERRASEIILRYPSNPEPILAAPSHAGNLLAPWEVTPLPAKG